jgi:ParB/RepB/Spo0J family partition protein
MTTRPPGGYRIADIKIGERFRRDLGDIAGLAASMDELGLLQSIVIRPDGTLIAGERRLRAATLLGWTHIPVKIVDLDAVVRGEYAENAIRKDFTLSEAVAIKRALEPIERAAAKERMRAGKPLENFSEGNSGRALDKIAKATGVSRITLARAEAIVDAAEAEPDKFGMLLAKMDRTGRVNGVFKQLKVLRQSEQIRAEPPPLPGNGPYRVIVADPPWRSRVREDDPSCRRIVPFPPMSVDEIRAVEIAALAHVDCLLWLWVTNADLLSGDALAVLKAWGFMPKSLLTWVKDRIGLGDWLRGQTEQCILAVRGSPTVTLTNESTALFALARGHSVKPREFYDLVGTLCPAPRYADLFSRYRHNDKWDCHGDEAPLAPGDPGPIPQSLRREAPAKPAP